MLRKNCDADPTTIAAHCVQQERGSIIVFPVTLTGTVVKTPGSRQLVLVEPMLPNPSRRIVTAGLITSSPPSSYAPHSRTGPGPWRHRPPHAYILIVLSLTMRPRAAAIMLSRHVLGSVQFRQPDPEGIGGASACLRPINEPRSSATYDQFSPLLESMMRVSYHPSLLADWSRRSGWFWEVLVSSVKRQVNGFVHYLSDCKTNGNCSIHHHFPGAILYSFCIFNRKTREILAFDCILQYGLIGVDVNARGIVIVRTEDRVVYLV